ncbi:MAG TPA: tetratricopeptide repeat protein [Thermoanaerobaculia bacterium]
MRRIALAVSLLLLAGCASAGPTTVAGVAHDLRQRGVDPASVVVPFEVTDEMRTWVHSQVSDTGPPEQRLDHLLTAIVATDSLGLTYEGGSTGTAREAFAARKANCLGFTSLFVGMARELGIPAFYLGVDDVERFERDGDLLVISGHVSAGFGMGGGKIKILEFTNAPKADYRHIRQLDDLTAIALYHSNHGAELLRAGRLNEALPWLREAVRIDPELGDAWVDLGVGLRRAGDLEGAEAAYRKALEVNPQGAAAYQNLAALLRLRGHAREADDLLALSTRASGQSPFSYLALGDLSLSQGRLDEARRFYRRAMWLNRDDPEPYAALGLAALAGGDRREAEKWLRKASARDKGNERVRRLESGLAEKTVPRQSQGGA